MKNRGSIASILILAGSLLSFFLPFVSVSCAGQKFFSISGQELATGTTISIPQPFGPPQTQKTEPEPFAAIAAICAIVGLTLSFIGRRLVVGITASAALGAICLLILRSRLSDQIQTQGQGLLQPNYETGFTLALLLMLIGAALNAYLFVQSRKKGLETSTVPIHKPDATGG